MLERARFQNFRCLRDVTIDFGPLTVLVGPNGSGKSSVLRGLAPNPVLPNDVWRHNEDLAGIVELLLSGGRRQEKSCQRRTQRLFGSDHSAQLLHLNLSALRQPNQADSAPRLNTDGSNLTNVLDTLSRSEQGVLAASFAQMIPTFSDVNVRPRHTGHQHLLFQDRWSKETWYTADEVSDGTILVLAYLVLQYQRPQVDLILVEEPERGIHPYLMGSLVALLRGMSNGEIGPHAVQIVLATHSADLLDHLEPGEVRFLTRESKDGSIRVDTVPAGTEAWQETYRNYDESLGSIWKAGGLRGVPGG